jgi:phycobilisome rod-core linker protein
MSLPLLNYNPNSQNHRVRSFEPITENRIYNIENNRSVNDIEETIAASYRQIFHEQQMIKASRQTVLESQLRSNQITVKEFIYGLATSSVFRQLNYDSNNNYRFVQLCVQRILGRETYSDREKMAWSVVLATKGLNGFINDLVNSQEYQDNFGDHTVPYQRRRILPQRIQGELPFERMARYGTTYRDQLPKPNLKALERYGNIQMMSPTRWSWQNPPYPLPAQIFGKALAYTGGTLITLFIITVFLTCIGLVNI